MDMSGFEKIVLVGGEPFISITDRATAFNQNAIMKLGSPEKVCLYFNRETKQLAVQPSKDNDSAAIPFLKKGKDPARGVRFNSKDLQYSLARLMDWDIDNNIYRISGSYDSESNVMVFSLNEATCTQKRVRK